MTLVVHNISMNIIYLLSINNSFDKYYFFNVANICHYDLLTNT